MPAPVWDEVMKIWSPERPSCLRMLASCFILSLIHISLALTGRDLIAAGVAPGPRIGQMLSAALDAAISGVVPNETAALLSWLDL